MRVLWIVILSTWQMNCSEQRQLQQDERNKSGSWTVVRKQTVLLVYGSWEMLIKSDLESPTVVLQAALAQRPPRPPHITIISQEKWEVSYVVFRVGNKNIFFLWSWEKVSLTIQGGFCVPKVYIRGKLWEVFQNTNNLTVSREQRTENTLSCGTHYLRVSLK